MLTQGFSEIGFMDTIHFNSEEQWRKILVPQLNNGQIDSFLSRRKQLIDSVEKARVRFGDDIFSSK